MVRCIPKYSSTDVMMAQRSETMHVNAEMAGWGRYACSPTEATELIPASRMSGILKYLA